MNIPLFKELVDLVKANQDCMVTAYTDGNAEINIAISKGDIIDVCFGDMRGVRAVTSSRHQTIRDYQVKDLNASDLPRKKLPLSTKSVLKILSSNLPKEVTYDPEQILVQETDGLEPTANVQATGNGISAVDPSRKLSDSIPNALEIVQECLTKVFGPISDVIYQEVDVESLSISTHQDLVNLINLICTEIEDEEEKYQRQFLDLLLQTMPNLISVDAV